jgi:hypothetical protein
LVRKPSRHEPDDIRYDNYIVSPSVGPRALRRKLPVTRQITGQIVVGCRGKCLRSRPDEHRKGHLHAGAGRAPHHAGLDRVLGVAAGEKGIRSAASASGGESVLRGVDHPTSARMGSSTAIQGIP